MKYLLKIFLKHTKTYVTKNARRERRVRSVDQVFGALAEFLRSPIKRYVCMYVIIFECYLLTYIFVLTRILIFSRRLKVTVYQYVLRHFAKGMFCD
jgi:hypothetical protein